MFRYFFSRPALVVMGVLAACQSAPDQTPQKAAPVTQTAQPRSLRQVVMDTHDSLMVQMGPLNRERKRLRKLLKDAAQSADTTDAAVKATRTELVARLAELEAAEAAMMDWMHAFREPDSTKLSAAQEQAFWKQQQASLHDVDCDIARALNRAKLVQ